MTEHYINILKSSLYAIFVYLGITTGIVKILFYLMLLDSFLGVIKALRLGHEFSFKKLGWGMVSKLTILIVPLIVALVGKGLSLNFNFFVVAIINILIVNEGISCITNILTIRTKKLYKNTDFITKLLELIKLEFDKIIRNSLKNIEKNNK